ncbi:uncharacterized protein LOC135629590 [Musa acuminata AAA Group]|uniref:uncharacterized protein LOC135629590 n=1 Tax=Musa acuminata AAA Group TaxID=214697 RepID=UPI0031D80AC6
MHPLQHGEGTKRLRALMFHLLEFENQAKAACVLIDLCFGPLSPWIYTITAKVDLAIELPEDLLVLFNVLLFVLGPHMPFPSDIDLCKCSFPKVADQESLAVSSDFVICSHGASSTSSNPDEAKRKIDASKAATRKDVLQDANL